MLQKAKSSKVNKQLDSEKISFGSAIPHPLPFPVAMATTSPLFPVKEAAHVKAGVLCIKSSFSRYKSTVTKVSYRLYLSTKTGINQL
ncbi:hypothetical protein AVEN_136185-1 [Araneus ventricosus]|uniref:Uncharacterized protein n=1 Tax=Araneus ventricosus TaxID=182803 RepID=A0A4Y2RAT8_ARAVE|nr:hypothetical protein AVEN_136185-1 [Araneus ventricosus]